ncbi:MAG: hypothetical protein RLZZ91_1395 [Bacteroidota bacterium]|jgi:hypothetical protein
MKYFVFSFYLSLSFFGRGHAQLIQGARMAALSGSAITQSDAFAGFHNLSVSSELKGLNCSFYGQIPYGISAINDAGVAFLKRFGTGVMGVVCQSYGNTEYNRKRVNVGYALALSPKLSASGSLGYSSTRIMNGYGVASNFWMNVGATYNVRKDWKWAAVADLPLKSIKNAEDLPATLRLGTTYSFGEQVNLSGQLSSSTSQTSSLSYSFGLEYFPIEVFAFRLGMNTHWQTWSMGVGTRLKNYSLDASATVHPQLGITPQISFTYGRNN